MSPGRLLFMRHGESVYNTRALCNGDPSVPVPLTPAGVAQAEEAAAAMAHEPLERIFTSELPRTRETAAIVNRHHGVPVTGEPALNDIRSGFEGRPVAEYQAAIAADPLATRPPGGESLVEHAARVSAFLQELERRPERTLLVVAHEETLRVVVARYRGLDLADSVGLSFANCQVLRFQVPETDSRGTSPSAPPAAT